MRYESGGGIAKHCHCGKNSSGKLHCGRLRRKSRALVVEIVYNDLGTGQRREGGILKSDSARRFS